MSVTANLFASFIDQALSGNINWPSDTIKCALLTSTAAPNLNTWVHYSDLTNEVAAGNGYSTGGVTITGKTHTVTAANSWATTWATSTVYSAGQFVIPPTPNGFIYQTTNGGTSGTAPTWATIVGDESSDGGGVKWSNFGESILVLNSTAPSWTVPASGTLSFQYAVFYDAQTGTGTTEPLIGIVNFGATQSFSAPAGGTLTGQINPFTIGQTGSVTGWFAIAPA